MKQNVQPLNAMPDGTCRTIKSQYEQTSQANMSRGSTFGATGVIVRYERDKDDSGRVTPI